MHENKQISSRARKLLPSAVWANVRWKRDGYYRTSPNQNRRWLVVGFRIRPISLGKSRRFYVHRPAPFRGFATRTKKKKKKKKKEKKKRTFVVSGGVRPNPPNPLAYGPERKLRTEHEQLYGARNWCGLLTKITFWSLLKVPFKTDLLVKTV